MTWGELKQIAEDLGWRDDLPVVIPDWDGNFLEARAEAGERWYLPAGQRPERGDRQILEETQVLALS
jgi:hypothetical protein